MGPLLRYLVIALFVVLGTSWLISSYQGCAKKDATSLLDDLDSTTDEDADLWEEDFEESDIADGDMDLSDDPDDLDAEIERLEKEMSGASDNTSSALASTKPATKTPIKPKAKTVSNRPTNYSPSKGAQYLVVAGSYSNAPNAEAMVTRLNAMGYTDSEVVEFDYSKYISVLAGRYMDEADARNLAEKLQADGVEAYVHKKR